MTQMQTNPVLDRIRAVRQSMPTPQQGGLSARIQVIRAQVGTPAPTDVPPSEPGFMSRFGAGVARGFMNLPAQGADALAAVAGLRSANPPPGASPYILPQGVVDAARTYAGGLRTLTGLATGPHGLNIAPSRGTFADTLGEGVAQLGVAAALGAATGGLGGLAVFAGTSMAPVVGDTYRAAVTELSAKNDPQAEQKATQEAMVAGIITGVTSALPGAAILRKVPGGDAVLRRAASRVVGRLAGAAGAEGLQEATEGVGQEIAQEMIRHDRRLTPEMAMAAVRNPQRMQEFLAGAVLGGAARVPFEVAGRAGQGRNASGVGLSPGVLPEGQPGLSEVDAGEPRPSLNPTTITPFPGTVGRELVENRAPAIPSTDDRLPTLLAAIEADPENPELQAALDAALSPEGLAVPPVAAPENVGGLPTNREVMLPRAEPVGNVGTQGVVGGGNPVQRNDVGGQAILSQPEPAGALAGDVRGVDQAGNPRNLVDPSSIQPGTSMPHTSGTSPTPNRPSEPTTAQTRASISGMSADQIRAELSSLNQSTVGSLPVLRKQLEKARSAASSPPRAEVQGQPESAESRTPTVPSGRAARIDATLGAPDRPAEAISPPQSSAVSSPNLTPDPSRADAAPDLSNLTLAQLRREAKARGVDPKGTRGEVLARFAQASNPSVDQTPSETPQSSSALSEPGKTTQVRTSTESPSEATTTEQTKKSSTNSTPREPWEMTRAERDAEIARLRADPVMHTPLITEGAISPTQINRMGERAKAKWQNDGQRKMLNQSRIRELSMSDAELAAERAAAEKRVADTNETRDRSRYTFLKGLEPHDFRGIKGSKKAYRAEYEALRARFEPSPAPRQPAEQPAPKADGEGVAGVGQGENVTQENANEAEAQDDSRTSETGNRKPGADVGRSVEKATGVLEKATGRRSALETKLNENIQAAKLRIARRNIPRGKGKGRSGATTIPGDLIDHVAILANKMALAGVKTFKAAADVVKSYIAVEAPEMQARANVMARRAYAIVRKATEDGGAIDLETIHRMTTEEARKTGQKEGAKISAREAAVGMEALAVKLRQQAKTREKNIDGIRAEFVRLARANVPLPVRGKLLGSVAKAKTYASLAAGIARARRVLIEYEARQALARVKVETRRATLAKLTRELRTKIVGQDKTTAKGATGLFETARLAYVTATDPKATVDDRENALRELLHTRDIITAAIKQHRDEFKIKKGDQWADVRIERAKVQAAVRKAGTDLGEVVDPKEGKPNPGAASRFVNALADTETFAMSLDGNYDGGGASHTLLYDALRHATTARQEAVLDVMQKADAIAKGYGYDSFGDFIAETSGTLGKATQQTIKLANPIGGRSEITLGQALKIYAMDQETQAQTLRGRQWNWNDDRLGEEFVVTAENLSDIARALEPKYRDMVDAMKALRETLRDQMFEVVRDIKGFEPPAVAGYEPRRTNPEKFKLEDFQGPTQDTDRNLEDMGITIERLPNGQVPLLITDFGHDWIKSIDQMTAIIHLAHPLRNARMVYLNNPPGTVSTASAIANRFGDAAVERIKTLLREVAGLDKSDRSTLENAMLRLTANVSRSLTSVNHRSWLKNAGGFIKAWAEADPGVIARGLARLSSPGLFDRMMTHSAYLKHRYSLSSSQLAMGLPTSVDTLASWRSSGKAVARDIANLNIGDLFGKSLPALVDHIRIAQWFDSLAARVLWAGYESTPRGRSDPKWVAEQVERVMRRTQNSSDVMDVAGITLANRRRAAVVPFLAFTSDANRSYNMIVRGFKRSQSHGWKAVSAVVANALWSAAVTGAFGQGIYALSAAIGGDDKEAEKRKDKAIADAAWQFVQDLASPAMGVDRIVAGIRGGIEGWSPKDATSTAVGSQITMTTKGITDAARAIATLIEGAPKKKRDAAWSKFWGGLADAAQGSATVFGIPGVGMARQIKRAGDLVVGD